ncbi:5167_t:CDS:10 [Acaulospora colombiana]|uniref:5167_t:CDS:1 n=1 Tax=Acaulospora colombiana TaxID=27376 RepID=A0ACA9MTQ3_9GLOM|nr:5167_t:CDS:10 [Acaulospora colombiana]
MSQLALVSNAFLEDGAAKFRSKPVPWEGYQRAGLITSDELTLIKRVDRQPRGKIESILVTDGPQYALLYLTLLKKIERVDTMQNILVSIGDVLADSSKIDPELPYTPFLKYESLIVTTLMRRVSSLSFTDTYLCDFSAEPGVLKPFQYSPLLHTISGLMKGSSPSGIDVAVKSLEALLPRAEIRKTVWTMPETIKGDKPDPQMTYQLYRQYDIIPLLTEAAQSAVKEKNLVSKAPESNLPAMLVVKLLPFVKNLSTRKWTDDDIVEDIQYLRDELAENFRSLTTYDEYTSELASGHLSWSPVHTSDEFWRENAVRLNEKDYQQLKWAPNAIKIFTTDQIIRVLVELLKTSNDPVILAVATHDIGQYVKFYDRGKKLTRVMELMSHENTDVRYQALITVQRLDLSTMPVQTRAKGKQADPKPQPQPQPEVKITYQVPDVQSLKSYGENDQEALKAVATEQLEALMNASGILRDDPKPAAKPTKGKGKQSAPPEEEEKEWLGGWDFFFVGKKNIKRTISKRIKPQLDYIERMKKAWRPDPPNKMEMPEDWFQEEVTIVLSNNRPWDMDKYDREKVNRTRMAFYTEPIGEHLHRVSTKDLIRRHLSTRLSQSILPDFCLTFRPTRPDGIPEGGRIEIYPCLERFLDIVNLPMGEHNLELCALNAFTNIPLCWLLMYVTSRFTRSTTHLNYSNPKQRFLEPLAYEQPGLRIEFALVHNTVRPFVKEEVEAAREMPISYTHPAVLLAMKGPTQWPDFLRKWDQSPHFEDPQWKAMTYEEQLQYCIEDLACAVLPSLDTLVTTWFLRVEQKVTPQRTQKSYPIWPPPGEDSDVSKFAPDSDDEEPSPKHLEWKKLPAWAWIPGILYDWNKCYLVAHIPVLPDDLTSETPVEYVSYVFDELEMSHPTSGDEDDRPCLLERVRLGLAWMALAKHAFKVSSLWENVIQPLEIMRYEEIAGLRENKYGFVEKPPSGIRQPIRFVNFEEDGYYNPYIVRDASELSIMAYQKASMDDVFRLDPEDEKKRDKKLEQAVADLKRQVTPYIEKWLANLEDPAFEFWIRSSSSR